MRDAALSLALTHPFAGQLANPRQMTAYTYSRSPAVIPSDSGFKQGPPSGAMFQDVAMEEGFLSDHFKNGFNVLCFGQKLAEKLAETFENSDEVNIICIPASSRVAQKYAATENSAYLLRPDMHIAAKWLKADATLVAEAYRKTIFQ